MSDPCQFQDGVDHDDAGEPFGLEILRERRKPRDPDMRALNSSWNEMIAEGAKIDCPICGGAGQSITVIPACCGNLTKGGECRAHCCVPEEVAEACAICGGAGVIHEPRPSVRSVIEEIANSWKQPMKDAAE